MDEREYATLTEWLCQRMYYNCMVSRCKEACDVYPTSEPLRTLSSLGHALLGKAHDAIKESSLMISDGADAFSFLLVQSVAYSIAGTADRSTIAQLDARIREERRRSTPQALARGALVLLLSRRLDKASECLERAWKTAPTNLEVLRVKGWLESFIVDRETIGKTNPFDQLLKEEPGHVNGLLGLARYKWRQGDHPGAISILNSLIVRYPKLCLPLIEKMYNQLAMKDWDQVMETANRILTIDANNLDAVKAQIVQLICKEGNYEVASRHLQSFLDHLATMEPRNPTLLIGNVRLFSRLACKDQAILTELSRATEKLLQQTGSRNTDLMVELGNLYVSLGKNKEAEHWYKNAVRLDESSFTGLMGLAQCQLLEGSLESFDLARQQIQFLLELRSSTISAELLYLSAMVHAADQDKALTYLNEAATRILNTSEHTPYGCEYLERLNPDLCLEMAKHRLASCSIADSMIDLDESVPSDNGKESTLVLLEKLADACPGLTAASLLLSRVRMQTGDLEGALVILRRLLDFVDPTNPEAHLLMARILAHQGKYRSASQSLEVGLSYNFKIREEPIYHLIAGLIQKENDETEEAIKSYETAMSYVGGLQPGKSVPESGKISRSDVATLYLELISAYTKIGRLNEALSLMQTARMRLENTPEESRIIIGNAELLLEMGDLDQAIGYLNRVKPEQPYYLQAHTRLAEINLKYRKDRHAFALCFRELVQHCPGAKTYSMLGDAYVSIQEPERAIEAYEQALRLNPANKLQIANKLGKALIKTHQYSKAVNYYRDTVQQEGCKDLKLDLARLFMKMKQYDKTESTLVQELQEGRGDTDVQSLRTRGQLLLLLAKAREKAENLRGALSALKEAKENQNRYIQRLSTGASFEEEKQTLADICLAMADYASSLRDYEQAIVHYKESLNHKPSDVKALLSLAKLYMQMNNLDRCAQSCAALLNADPNNEAASVMMADLAFRKVDFETAAFHFRQLLLRQPTYWTALARLIEVSRRTGNMDDLEEWLHRAEAAMSGTNLEAGYYYCAGLLDWRTGRLNSALRQFNFARRDPEWGQQAIYNMIEICLDPDDDSSLSNEVFNDDDAEYQDSRTMALKTAYRLLQELNPKGSPHEMLTHRLLSNFFLLATKQKSNIEKALQDCTSLASQEPLRDHVGPALGMAMAHILLKQTPRARNHLKRVSKNVWTFEDAEYLERCWLLLADIYVQSSKYELANELLRRVLQHNATCVRAHELSGQVAEKDQNYREAAARYGQAWRYGGKAKLSIGYKLAYCSSKAKLYADAIEACNEVLKQNPDYPRIRKDILEKCINNLRT